MDKAKIAQNLQAGKPLILYDGSEREGEADLVLHASMATPEMVRLMRRDGGGLVCIATNSAVAETSGLPFISDLLEKSGFKGLSISRTPYGDRPAFSLSINHRETFTGITDEDRALTANKFAEFAAKGAKITREEFEQNFYSPGHVHLLIGRGLNVRRGHTELSLEIARLASMPPAMLLCEMLGKGKALEKNRAAEYAKINGLQFIEGKDLL